MSDFTRPTSDDVPEQPSQSSRRNSPDTLPLSNDEDPPPSNIAELEIPQPPEHLNQASPIIDLEPPRHSKDNVDGVEPPSPSSDNDRYQSPLQNDILQPDTSSTSSLETNKDPPLRLADDIIFQESAPPPTHILAPPPPPPELVPQFQRKSVTWSTGFNDSDSGNIDSADSHDSSSQGVGHYDHHPRSLSSIPRIRRSRRSTLGRRHSNVWLKDKLANFMCCGYTCAYSVVESDSDEEWNDFTPSKMKIMGEEETFSRLQQAVNVLCHRPTSYDIEAEIQKWHRTLELEQKAYEESGKPKFKYKWFRKNQYLTMKKHPLYGTNYENHRKLEVRLEEFRFGASKATNYFGLNSEVKYGHANAYESKDPQYWRSDIQVLYANLALLCSGSNFMRFPQACYVNGGFTFLLTYCLMIATVGQPLLYFEMILGQLSLHGPSGFARLHPYAKGLPHAIAFVCVTFGASRSVYLAYSILYSLISLVASPGMCGWWYSGDTKCVPYQSFEKYEDLLKVELFFREVMLDAEWTSGAQTNYAHWKLILGYILVCCIALVPIHYDLGGKTMKRYLRYSSRFIPVMILIIFLHQIFSRGAMSLATQYFLTVDSEHVSALSVWSEAFEMMLSTLGIGYGYHWAVSGNISLDYKDTYRMSWQVCGFAVLYGVVSSLVLFCEIGIVGELTGDVSHYKVFYERLGITFVCYSGALYKLGQNTVALIFVFFLLFVLYGMWSQVIIGDIILRWIEHRHIIKGPTDFTVNRKKSSLVIVIALQLFIMSPYFFTKAGSVFASENIFGGALAAYLVVLAELLVAIYFYGFAKFLADLEIMTKRPTPTLFQFQIRYLVIPTIVIFMLPMTLNVYLYPSIYVERNKLGWLFYFGLMANFAPVVILLVHLPVQYPVPFKIKTPNKVTPIFKPMFHPTFDTSTMDEIRKRYPLTEPTFVSKVNAPSQTSHGLTIRSELYQVVEHNMEFCHKCQDFVKKQFEKLLRFKIVQRRWLKLVVGVLTCPSLGRIEIKSMPSLIVWIMLAQKCRNSRVDVGFLNQALEQIVNLTFSTAIRKLQRMPMQEMLLYMTDELLKLTIFRTEDTGIPCDILSLSSNSSSASSNDDENMSNDNLSSSSSSTDNHGDHFRPKYLQIHRRLVGQMRKTPEEMRTLLTIRLKRGLGLPHEEELSVLKFLRRQRAKQEREMSCWTQNETMPIDHFIPSSISNQNKEKICFTIFHTVVVEGSDHFALKKLPVPRPPIVRVTKKFVQSQPGKTLTDKFAHIVTKRMHRNIRRIIEKRNLKDISKNKLKRHLWRVSDRVDDDVYDFLDRILTCVIVIVPDSEAHKKLKRPMYLTPRTIRKTAAQHASDRRTALTDHEIQSYAALNTTQRQSEYWIKLLEDEEPPDLRYHSDSSDSEDSVWSDDDILFDAKSSSGSTSTLSPSEVDVEEDIGPSSERNSLTTDSGTDIPVMVATKPPEQRERARSQYLLVNETLQHRDERMLKKKSGFGVKKLEEKEGELAEVCLSLEKIKHISARRWKHERDKANKEVTAQTSKKAMIKFSEKELSLQRNVDYQASRVAIEAVASKSMEMLKSAKSKVEVGDKMKKAVSLESIRHLLESQAEFKVDMSKGEIVAISKDRMDSRRIEGKLKNANDELQYISFGKTLIVDHGMKLSSYSVTKRNLRSIIGKRLQVLNTLQVNY